MAMLRLKHVGSTC